MIDSNNLNSLIESGIKDTIQQNINNAVEKMVVDMIEDLQQSPEWIEQLQNTVNQSMVHVLQKTLSGIDLKQEITRSVFENKELIANIFKKDFSTLGIKDASSHTQLTVMDGAVVVENELYTNDFTAERTATFKGDLVVTGDLALLGTVNVDNASWNELADHISETTYQRVAQDFQEGTLERIAQLAKEGIDLGSASVNGKLLVRGTELASTITESSLTQVGTLKNLSVDGRIGINTDSPTDTLSLWDEEVNVVAGKHSKNTAYIGTSKNQDLVIGTNKQKQLTVSADGGVTVNSLTVGTNNISFISSVPNHSGTKGDIVFNKDLKDNQPFAWVCLGNYRWQPLHAS